MHYGMTPEGAKRLGYNPDRIFGVERAGPPNAATKIKYWGGEYKGVGLGADNTPLFCTLRCALCFACRSWDAGVRVRRDK